MQHLIRLGLVAVMTLAALPAVAGPIGYVVNFGGQFGTMDLGTGALTAIGGGVPNTPDGIAGAPGGPMYTVDGITGHLLRIQANGTVTDIGDTGTGPNVGPNGISVIGGLRNGSVFGLDFTNHLYSINTATAAMTLLGSLALPTQESEYIGNMTTSFNGDGSKLYYTVEILSGPNATGPTLYVIDPVTLQIVAVPLSIPGSIIGSGFVEGSLYAFTDFGHILTINTTTGVGTLMAMYDSGSTPANPGPPFTGVFGVVATPEPATYLLIGVGLAAVGLRRKLRQRS